MCRLNAYELRLARDWIADCVWGDLEDVSELTDQEVERGVARHFYGGVEAFKETCKVEE